MRSCGLGEPTLANEDDSDPDHSPRWPGFFPGQLNELFCFFKYKAHGDLVGLGALRTVLSALYASQASSFVSLSSLLLSWKWMLCDEQGSSI
jgi:hypothetical protein